MPERVTVEVGGWDAGVFRWARRVTYNKSEAHAREEAVELFRGVHGGGDIVMSSESQQVPTHEHRLIRPGRVARPGRRAHTALRRVRVRVKGYLRGGKRVAGHTRIQLKRVKVKATPPTPGRAPVYASKRIKYKSEEDAGVHDYDERDEGQRQKHRGRGWRVPVPAADGG